MSSKNYQTKKRIKSKPRKTVRFFSSQGRKSHIDSEMRMLQFSPISFIEIFLMALPMLIYLFAMYYGRDPYGDFSGILLAFGTTGIIGTLIMNRKNAFKLQYYYLEDSRRQLLFLVYVTVTVAALGVLWWLLGYIIKFGLSAIELYFYYLGAAVMEEVFFRMFLCGLLKIYVFGKFKYRMPDFLENLWIILISSILFMIAHTITYGANINAMLIMFFGGMVFAGVYLGTKDIAVTITAHMIVNLLSVGTLLMSM